MRHEVLMPRLAEEVEEGVVVTWFAERGAMISEGDLLAELQVQKVSSELHSPFAGRLTELLVEPGGVVKQGDPIAVIEDAEAAEAAAKIQPEVQAAVPSLDRGTPPASPSARRLARELGVDLAQVKGSGPEGRVVEANVRAAAAKAPAATTASTLRSETEPISEMRRSIAERLRGWLASTAQLTLTAEADVTDLVAQLEAGPPSANASLLAAGVRAAALALRHHPRINARWTDSGLSHPASIDIGVAVALDDGLITPVVRAADVKNIQSLDADLTALAARARSSALKPSEVEGACFSVTNLGAYRIDAFTPLLNPPQTAILGIGRARRRPAVVGEAVVPRLLMVVSLTFDHRVADGAPAAAFLTEVVELLERPRDLLASEEA